MYVSEMDHQSHRSNTNTPSETILEDPITEAIVLFQNESDKSNCIVLLKLATWNKTVSN